MNTEEIINREVEKLRKELTNKLCKKEFEVGKVYRSKYGYIFKCTKFEKGRAYGYGFSDNGVWEEECLCATTMDNWQESTPEEWKSALIEEAKRRYKKGDTIRLIKGMIGSSAIIGDLELFDFFDNDLKLFDFFDNELKMQFLNHTLTVYCNGVWAEIITEKTSEDYVNEYAAPNPLRDFLNKHNLELTVKK